MIKTFLLIFILTVLMQADIKDECYYMNYAQYTKKCYTGNTGDQAGRMILLYLLDQFNWKNFIFDQEAENFFHDRCKRHTSTYHKNMENIYYEKYHQYFMEHCMEVLYSSRKELINGPY
jgi:hypothetical protein